MSRKARIVFLDRAAFPSGELPVPAFDHTWSEYPSSEEHDLVPRLFWATVAITHERALSEAVIARLHKLERVVVTGSANVDASACRDRGIAVEFLTESEAPQAALIKLLEAGDS